MLKKMQIREVVIDRIENGMAVLSLEDGQELMWPEEELPSDASEGDVMKLSLASEDEMTEDREGTAKAILNEIFDTDDI